MRKIRSWKAPSSRLRGAVAKARDARRPPLPVLFLLLSALRAAAQGAPVDVQPPPGAYAADTALRLSCGGSAGSGSQAIRYAFRTISGEWGPWIPYRAPILLSAAPGEERSYSLLAACGTAERELSYLIDRRPPPAPAPDRTPGRYYRPIEIAFRTAGSESVEWALEGAGKGRGGTWDGTPLSLGKTGELETMTLRAYAVDAAGNCSPVGEYRYDMDLRPATLDLLSPVSGTFANPQPLFISFRNVEWIRYSLDGSDPAVSGIPYRGLSVLPAAGKTSLKVAARARSGEILRAEVVVRIQPDASHPLSVSTESGAYPAGFILSFPQRPGSRLRYTAVERTPDSRDPPPPSSLAFETAPAIRRSVTIRVKDLDAGAGEYRWFYVLDGRTPPAPRITLLEGAGLDAWASEDALLFYSLDGSEPGPDSPPLQAPVPIPADGGAVTFTVVAMAPSSARSPAAVLRIPESPQSTPLEAVCSPAPRSGGEVLLSMPQSAPARVVYEISSDGREPPAPSARSPLLQGSLSLSVPYGMEKEFRIRLASLDEWGRVSRPMDAQSVFIDRQPPYPPVPGPLPDGMRFEEPAAIRVASPGEVRVEMTSDGGMPRDPTADSALMPEAGLTLAGEDGRSVTYRLKMLGRDEWGHESVTAGPYALTVDRRIPQVPAVLGVSDGGRYGDAVVGLSVAPGEWNLHFTSGSGAEEPPDPSPDSPLLVDGLFFTGDAGTVTAYCVKILPTSRDGKRTGPVRTVRFAVDREPPEVPELAGIRDGAAYGSAVTLSLDQAPEGVEVSVAVARDGEGEAEPFSDGTIYRAPVTADVPEGASADFTVRLMARDDVGNRSPIERVYRFRIDRAPPADPVLAGITDGSVGSGAVTVAFSSDTGRVVYEIGEGEGLPAVPSPESTGYAAPFTLSGRPDAKVVYSLLPRAIDEAGNMSPAGRIYTLTVDRTLPAVPAEPAAVPFPKDGGSLLVQWAPPENATVFWRRIPPGDAPFQPYAGAILLPVDPADPGSVLLEAYAENSAGVRSLTASFVLPVARKLPAPAFTGAPDGGVSNTGLRIGLRGSEGEIRYEAAADGAFPPEVSADSPLYGDPIPLDAADGQTAVYRIAARAFGREPAERPSDETRILLTVDRTPPPPPAAEGIEDGGHYQDTRRVALRSSEGRIFWTLSEGASFQPYTEPVALAAADGRVDLYRLRAYTVDDAGNRSREVRAWSVTMDRKTVHVDASGNDGDDGTWGSPVRSLARALEIARLSGRTSLLVSAGTLPIDAPLAVTSDVTIVGGLDPLTWEPRVPPTRTVLVPDAKLMRGRTAVAVRGGSLRASGLDFRGLSGSGGVFLEVAAGDAALADVGFLLADVEEGTAVRLSGGSLSMKGCRLEALRVGRGSLLAARTASILLEESTLAGPDGTAGFRALELSTGASFEMNGGSVRAGQGQEPTALFAQGARLTLRGVTLEAGRGTRRATGLDLSDCTTSLVECRIAMDAGTPSSSAVSAGGGSLSMRACRIEAAASIGATGILLKACAGDLGGCVLRGGPSSEYLYLLHQSGGRVRLHNSVLLGDSAGDSACIYLAEGVTDLFNNTVIAGTGSRTTAAVIVGSASVPRIVNNIFARREGARGTAIELIGASAPAAGFCVLTNAFSGWESLLLMGPAAGSSSRRRAHTVEQLQEILPAAASGNVAEAFWKTFRVAKSEEFALAPGSLCRDGGTDLRDARFNGPVEDIQGRKRPASIRGKKEAYDIGAEEAAD